MSFLATLALTVAAAASPTPTPAPLPSVAPFAAHAHATVRITNGERSAGATVRLAVAQREGLVRFDLLSMESTGIPIPPVTATAVVDTRTRAVTIWSDATKKYWRFVPRVGGTKPRPAPQGSPAPAASASPRAARPPSLGRLDVFELALKLTGHGTVVGLPATGFSLDTQGRMRGSPETTHLTGTVQLADDTAVPLAAELALERTGSPSEPLRRIAMAYTVEDFTRTLPPSLSFTVPDGYTEATSFLAVILGTPPAH